MGVSACSKGSSHAVVDLAGSGGIEVGVVPLGDAILDRELLVGHEFALLHLED